MFLQAGGWSVVNSLVQPRDPKDRLLPDPVKRVAPISVEIPWTSEEEELRRRRGGEGEGGGGEGSGVRMGGGRMSWVGRKKTQLLMQFQRNAAVIVIITILACLVLYLLTEVRSRDAKPQNLNATELIALYGDKLGLNALNWGELEGLDIAMGLGGMQKPEPEVLIHHTPPVFMMKSPTDRYIDYMEIRHPPFTPNYRNPCWAEELPYVSPYRQGYFYNNPPAEDMDLEGMEQRWQDRIEAGKEHRIRCLPYFYIIGFPNAGTMDLYRAVHKHPEIIEVSGKATNWWSKHRVGESSEGFVPIGNFVDLFDEVIHILENHTVAGQFEDFHPYVIGDASPNTVWYNDMWHDLPENEGMEELDEPRFHNGNYLRHIQPTVHLIMMLRNPVKRLYSECGDNDPEKFHEMVKNGIDIMNECLDVKSAWSCVNSPDLNKQIKINLRLGMYYVYVTEWLKIFHRDNLYIMRFEDLVEDPGEEMKHLFRFLRLDPLTEEMITEIEDVEFEHGDHEFKDSYMKDETKELLDKFYEPWNKKLNTIMYTRDKYLWSDES